MFRHDSCERRRMVLYAGTFALALGMTTTFSAAQISVDLDASDGNIGASVGGLSASIGNNGGGSGGAGTASASSGNGGPGNVGAQARVRARAHGRDDRKDSGLDIAALLALGLPDPSLDARLRLGLGGTRVGARSSTDLSELRSRTRVRIGKTWGASGDAIVDLDGDRGDIGGASAGLMVRLGLAPDPGDGVPPEGDSPPGTGLPPDNGRSPAGAGLPPGAGNGNDDSGGDGNGIGIPGLQSVSSVAELRPAINRLGSDERVALRVQCSEVISEPGGYEAALVSLCGVVLRIM